MLKLLRTWSTSSLDLSLKMFSHSFSRLTSCLRSNSLMKRHRLSMKTVSAMAADMVQLSDCVTSAQSARTLTTAQNARSVSITSTLSSRFVNLVANPQSWSLFWTKKRRKKKNQRIQMASFSRWSSNSLQKVVKVVKDTLETRTGTLTARKTGSQLVLFALESQKASLGLLLMLLRLLKSKFSTTPTGLGSKTVLSL